MSTLPTEPSTTYMTIRPTLGTGDLFFLHSQSEAGLMVENLEQAEGWPPYSHIGMVIKDDGGELFFWDAPGKEALCFPDPYATKDPDNRLYGKYTSSNGAHPGCRVSMLDDVLAYYAPFTAGYFWYRQLQADDMTADRFYALRRFVNRVDGMPFPEGELPFGINLPGDVVGLGANFIAGQDRASFFFGTYFCAQLVADSYMHMGLLDMELFPPNGYSPAAFTLDGTTRLPLVGNAKLGPVTYVKWDGQAKNQPCDCPDFNPPPPAN